MDQLDNDIDEKEYAFSLMCSLNAMRKEKIECDLVIKVGTEDLSVHRNVMRARSVYLDAMLSHDTLENQSGVVEMKEMKFEPVKKCVDFFYTGKISISDENCEELLYTASMMLIKPVCDKIARFLKSHLNPKSFFNIKLIASQYSLKSLNQVCVEFALDHLNVIAKEDEFNQLDNEYVCFLLKSKKSFGCKAEDSKLALLLQWIKYDVEGRQQYLSEMLSTVDLMKISPGTVRFIIEHERLFSEFSEWMKRFMLASLDKSEVQLKPLEVCFPTRLDANAIICFDLSAKDLQAYYPSTNLWVRMHRLHVDMLGKLFYTAVTYANFVYVLMSTRKLYRLDISVTESDWVEMNDMLKGHGVDLRATVHQDSIYVAGNNSMERYSIAQNAWEEIDCSSVVCNCTELVEFEHRIYSIGGIGGIYSIGGIGGATVKDVNMFSPSLSTWCPVTPMLIQRHVTAAAVLRGKVYVSGGYGGKELSYFECYDPKTSSWSKLPSMANPRSCFSLLVVDGKLFAVGHHENPCTIEMYDFDSKSWKAVVEKPDMKIMARATVAAYLKG